MYEKEKKRVCYHCVNEGFLKAEIKRTGKTRKCSYCEQIAVGISLLELAYDTPQILDSCLNV